MFPALVNCCTIDWFREWPAEALASVATSFFQVLHIPNSAATAAHADAHAADAAHAAAANADAANADAAAQANADAHAAAAHADAVVHSAAAANAAAAVAHDDTAAHIDADIHGDAAAHAAAAIDDTVVGFFTKIATVTDSCTSSITRHDGAYYSTPVKASDSTGSPESQVKPVACHALHKLSGMLLSFSASYKPSTKSVMSMLQAHNISGGGGTLACLFSLLNLWVVSVYRKCL